MFVQIYLAFHKIETNYEPDSRLAASPFICRQGLHCLVRGEHATGTGFETAGNCRDVRHGFLLPQGTVHTCPKCKTFLNVAIPMEWILSTANVRKRENAELGTFGFQTFIWNFFFGGGGDFLRRKLKASLDRFI